MMNQQMTPQELIDFTDEMAVIAERMAYALDGSTDPLVKPFYKIMNNLVNATSALQIRIQDAEEYDSVGTDYGIGI